MTASSFSSSDDSDVSFPYAPSQIRALIVPLRRPWTSDDQKIAQGLRYVGVPVGKIAQVMERSSSVVSGHLNPEKLRRKRELERSRQRELQLRRQQMPIVLDHYCGNHPKIPTALRNRIREVTLKLGGSWRTPGLILEAARMVATDPHEPWCGHPLLHESRIKQVVKTMAQCWKEQSGEHAPRCRPLQIRRTIESGIKEVFTFRLDTLVTATYRASLVSPPFSLSRSFPTLELARAWRKLAQQAVEEGSDPRTVPCGPLGWYQIMSEANMGSNSSSPAD